MVAVPSKSNGRNGKDFLKQDGVSYRGGIAGWGRSGA